MYCPNCGRDCEEAKFCSECGQKLRSENNEAERIIEYPPLNKPFVQMIAGKEIDLHQIIRAYGMGRRRIGAYYYLAHKYDLSNAEVRQILDPIFEAHAGEKVSFWSSFFASANIQNEEKWQKRKAVIDREEELKASGQVYCPKCLSISVTAQKRGYSVGQSFLGGPRAGAIGANKVQCVCLKCGYKWEP